jgi:hypothetical protein
MPASVALDLLPMSGHVTPLWQRVVARGVAIVERHLGYFAYPLEKLRNWVLLQSLSVTVMDR